MVDETTAPVEQLIQQLLDTGTMNEDSVADLERMRADFRAGSLHPDDESYLVAFHRRIIASLDGEVVEAVPATSETADLSADLAAALERAERAEAEVARLNALLAERDAPPEAPSAP
jgi:hypothetical protein